MNEALLEQLKKIVRDSEIMREDDHSWPPPDKVGRQELEVVMDGEVCERVCVCVCLYVFVFVCEPVCRCMQASVSVSLRACPSFLSFLAIPERQYK